jgi:purine-nucleoside phosphorylase
MPSLTSDFSKQITAATEFVRGRWPGTPRFGIVLGTGAGRIAQAIETEHQIDYGEIPHFPRSTALGHKGCLVCGQLVGHDVIAMQGRFHLYEGYRIDQATLPIHVMHRLGVGTVFITNASGGVNPKFDSADIMLIESHIDLMLRTSPNIVGAIESGRPLMRSDAYDVELIDQAMDCSRKNGFTVHRGIYAAMLGPNYETRAEYRFLRRIGSDVVGMSTVPEVTIAAKYGMRILGMSVITNVAKPDVLESTSGQEVINAAEIAAPHLRTIVANAIENS